MKRREFFNYSLPATGAILLSPGLFNFQAFAEIQRQFTGEPDFQEYDLVINGAGLAGYFAANFAASKGLKVLIVEKRSSPGYEITAKRKLWIGSEGLDKWDNELSNLFFPEGERKEIFNQNGSGPNGSLFNDELLLFSGTVKKALLRNLLVNNIHVMLMTDVCGILSDNESVMGVLLATKQGLYSVKCSNFVDATDNLLFSREVLSQPYEINKAGFVMELLNVKDPEKKIVEVPNELEILNNSISLHQGKNIDHQLFIEFQFPVKSQHLEDIEIQARNISAKLGRNLSLIDEGLKGSNIHYYALETSIYLVDNKLPDPQLNGYYILPTSQDNLTCTKISQLKALSENEVEKIKPGSINNEIKNIIIIGGKIPSNDITYSDPNEPGFTIPLKKIKVSSWNSVNHKEETEVLVAGGGTAGAVATIGALERGSKSIVIDYFNDLGGTKTMGGVMGYYHGMTDNSFIKFIEDESSKLSADINFSKKIGRKIFLLEQILQLGGRFISGSIIADTIVENDKVKGIVICRNGKLSKISADITIDATGDGDVAHFAGAGSDHGNTRTGKTQNYSQWSLTGGGKPPSNPTSDHDIIDNTKISELQRGFFLSHYESHFYDFHPYLTVRESRRIKGLYELTLIDASEQTHFKDMIGIASSDYDPHYVGNSEFTRCGFLLPHSNIVIVEIPYRSIVPAEIDGLLISGKAISQTHNALQFTRMSADITLLGYVTGQIAAHLVIENIKPKNFDVSKLQKEWFERGYFPAEYEHKDVGNKINDNSEIDKRVNFLAEGKSEYLYECCKLPADKVLPKLKKQFADQLSQEGKLLVAKALAWFGESQGDNLILAELEEMFMQEQKQGYPDGYVENYDFIRGREKNVLEGLFWRINQNIALLAMSGSSDSKNMIRSILENTESGGEVINWTGDRGSYFNSRIDLRIIPFYNRILNLCFYIERNPDEIFIKGLEKLLNDDNIQGFITEEYHSTRWRLYGGNLEVYIGASLARCGSQVGYKLLTSYLDDIHFNFKDFAAKELKSISAVDYGFDKKLWQKHIARLKYPQPGVGYTQKIEL